MSIRTLNDDILRWFRCFFDNGPANTSFSLTFKLYKQQTDAASANKPLFSIFAPGGADSFHCWFQADGKTVYLAQADKTTNASSNHAVTVEEDNWYEISLIGWMNGGTPTWWLIINGTVLAVTGLSTFQFGQFIFGNDYYEHIDVEIEDYLCLNFALSQADALIVHTTPNPWSLYTDAQVIAFGSCRGADYDTALATLSAPGAHGGAQVWGNGFSNHQGVLGDETFAYGTSVSGSGTLPLAYDADWVTEGADAGSTPTTPVITVIPAGHVREKVRVLPAHSWVPAAGKNTDGRYQVDIQANSSGLETASGASGAIHSPNGITHPDGGWAYQRTSLNGKPRYYHRIGPGMTIFGNTFRSEYGTFGAPGEVEHGAEHLWVMMTRWPSSAFQPGSHFGSYFDVHLQDENTSNRYTGAGPLGMWGNPRTGVDIYTRLGLNGVWQTEAQSRHNFQPVVDTEYWWSFKFKMNFTGSAYLKVGKAIGDGAVSEVVNYTGNFGADAQPSHCFCKEGIYDFDYPWAAVGDNKIERYSAGHVLWDNSGEFFSHEEAINTLRYQVAA